MPSSLARSLIAVGVMLSTGILWVHPAQAETRATASVVASNTSFGGFQSIFDVEHTDEVASAFAGVVGGFGRSSATLGGTITAFGIASAANITASGLIIDEITLTDPTPLDGDSGARLTLAASGTTSGTGGLLTALAVRGLGAASQSLIVDDQFGSFAGPDVHYVTVYKLPGGTYDLVIGMTVVVNGVGVANFEDTLTASIDVPPGVTFTSASGMFLTQQEPPPPTPPPGSVPEPATLFLTGVALAGVWATRRRFGNTAR